MRTQLKNMLIMTNLLLLAILALLGWLIFQTQRDASGDTRKAASSKNRFQPFSGNPDIALDTKTGNLCATIPAPQPSEERPLKKKLVLVDGQRQLLPVCSQLE